MDEDLAGKERDDLIAEIEKLRAGIREHRDSSGQELCWHHPRLWGLLPEKTDPLPVVPEWPQFMRGCVFYRQSLDVQAPHAPRSDEPYREAAPDGDPAITGAGMYKGSCLCGNVQYEITGDIGEFGYCHCTSCRKASGSAHAANAPIQRAQFHLLAGADTLREFESSPGKRRAFCSRCGSPIYALLAESPEIMRIRLGSLDTPFTKTPQAHTWVSDKAPWEPIDDRLPQFHEWAPKSVLEQKGSRQP